MDSGRSLTQMSLLKLIFYAHGWYLASKHKPLFKQPVEAWEHGPVVKVVRDAFKDFGKRPIDRFADRLDLSSGEFVPIGFDLSLDDKIFVADVFSIYENKSAFELSDMTHEKDSPWDKVWNTKAAVGRLGLRIRNEDIEEYFRDLLRRGTIH
ncbi:MAG: DUF4065 domain-containing protein [Sphingomonas sp.]|nr:MAG: DUF4065 domain-containing protein [Sphingomonas sp.]